MFSYVREDMRLCVCGFVCACPCACMCVHVCVFGECIRLPVRSGEALVFCMCGLGPGGRLCGAVSHAACALLVHCVTVLSLHTCLVSCTDMLQCELCVHSFVYRLQCELCVRVAV